ncbi:MAG: hypothetical protein KDA93_12125 [Planctomycetaceae bacterium]|nr:hypothetical protein [Planctomycetaceae bacterium]
MWENMKFKSDNNSGSWAAAYFILTLGMVGLSALALAVFNDRPETAWIVLGVVALLLILSIVLRRIDLPSSTLGGIFGGRGSRPLDYEPRLKGGKPKSLEFGTNSPPTVEDIRQAKESSNNWVPHGSASGRRSPRKR